MASKIVQVSGTDWTELSAAEKGCFENQTSDPLLYWVAAAKPAATVVKGHSLSQFADKGFQLNTSSAMKLYGRTLSVAGDVIVTEY
ncbi:MAG: hypothetical protein KJ856_05755 [Gammaproteobacteria bacterium]|uniref:Uncharacterized protein n=1 Tax=viral metagenome TaxID=1070528 RepID=A0A6H1ZQN2_9ZZZZ|nr:hypothetical protein [Gammaproteobacteria bacterium]MBU1477444.1 hypothetical protein [Gammaproteobacteria bacterium]MBU2002607.1 hypothetical protein [Gammaproteobacteria bacterium]MBU2131782.1 hypothetical protein [Gammaproteobacteria bacterium]MBU2186517.1 hypothetical protein [Gammaproteobacteria bacterium]